MKGRTYVENNLFVEMERERQLTNHHKRLEEIERQATKKNLRLRNKAKYSKDFIVLKQMHYQRRKNFEFKNVEKTENLNKENQILLNRLLEISSGNHKTATIKNLK